MRNSCVRRSTLLAEMLNLVIQEDKAAPMSQASFLKEVCAAVWRDRHASREQLLSIQRKRLAELIRHARERVPFQIARLRRRASNPFRFEELEAIEPADKQTMMRFFEDTVADRAITLDDVIERERTLGSGEMPWLRNGRYLLSKTSGTSGEAAWFINDAKSWAIQRGAVMARTIRDRLVPRELARFSFGRRYRMSFLVTDCIYSVSLQSALSASRMFANIRPISILESTEDAIQQLNEFRPHYLHGFPTYLELIAHRKLDGEPISFDPEIISMGSEAQTASAREAIATAFPNAMLTNQYGSTECVPLGNQCSAGRMHLNIDYCIVEPRTASGGPCAANEFSDHVLITNLVNRAQPIIRYRLDDSIRVLEEPCVCGRGLPVFEIQGRSDDTLVLLDDSSRWRRLLPLGIQTVLLPVAGVGQFQVVHEKQNVVRIRFTARGENSPVDVTKDIQKRFSNFLNRNGLTGSVRLLVDRVEQFERPAGSGKLRQIISLVKQPSVLAKSA